MEGQLNPQNNQSTIQPINQVTCQLNNQLPTIYLFNHSTH